MTLTLDELSCHLKQSMTDESVRLVGDSLHEVERVASIHNADNKCVTFFNDERVLSQLGGCQAGAVILKESYCASFDGNKLVVANPLLAFALIAEHLNLGPETTFGIHPSAVIDPTATLEANVQIAANVVIGAHTSIAEGVRIGAGTVIGSHCTIGSKTTLDPHVVIFDKCKLGKQCRISSGAVIGSAGFGYVRDGEKWRPVPQLAGVSIGDEVDIGANATVDCGALDDTVIEDFVKLDDHVHIAHNCSIGENTIIAGCAGVAGSTKIGRRCMLGGKVSVMDHIEIADDVIVEGTSFVSKSITTAGVYSSIVTAQEAGVWKRNSARLHRLDGMAKRLRALEKKVDSKL